MPKTKSIFIVSFAYLAAFVVGVFLTRYLPQANSLSKLFFIDVLLTLFIFMFSFRFGNASIYDPYWSVIPIYMVAYWWFETLAIPQVMAWVVTATVVLFWGSRLTYNWMRGWPGMQHQDWRYSQLQDKTGKWYVLVNFLGIHLFPTLLVWMAMVPVAYIFTASQPFNALNWLGVGIALAGVGIETLSDAQLHTFKKTNKDKGVINSGLWRWVRHPNYLGEMLFWWGLYLMAVGDFTPWYVAAGATSITLLFKFVSIPMMDKHLLQKRPEYAAQMLSKGAVLPKFH